MPASPISTNVGLELTELSQMVQFFTGSRWAQRQHEPGIADFMLGNPHDSPVAGFAEALAAKTVPRSNDWFAYKLSEPGALEVVAASLKQRTGLDFAPTDIAMTNGAWAGLAVSLRTVVDQGDEVIYVSPPWFFYRTLIRAAGGTPVRVDVRASDFDLDLDAISAAITPRTRAVMINSPHNPTGKIYSRETLDRLAALLTEAFGRNGRPIYVISDEAYCRILFDGRDCPSMTSSYPYTFLIYTYGKTLLTPGQRIGYVAMSPSMPDKETVGYGLLMSQIITGYAFPNALMQHALADLETLIIDIPDLQRKRDRMVSALLEQGYQVTNPESTFYIVVRAPGGDEVAYCELLAAQDVYVLPGYVFEMPGYFRISLTATNAMIDQALPVFARAIKLTS